MINVIVSMKMKEGKAEEFIKSFKQLAVKVKQERGCIDYFPAKDVDAGMPMYTVDPNSVTIIERWENLDALKEHLASPDMQSRQANDMEMTESVTMKMVQEV